jgi:signal transduction histidine kinase
MSKLAQNPLALSMVSFTGQTPALRANISPMLDADGNQLKGHLIILYDATAEHENQVNREQFVTALAQDIRTPMTSISGYVDLLLNESVGVLGDMQRKFLHRVKANIKRMDTMLNNLITIISLEADTLEMNLIRLDIALVIENAIVDARAKIQEKDIDLLVDLAHPLPPLEADENSMKQIMDNLCNNAIEVSPDGSSIAIQASVTTRNHYDNKNETNPTQSNALTEEQRWLQITVQDAGGGIAKDDLPTVFSHTYLPDAPLIQGVGDRAGLKLVKDLVEKHGGQVWLETEIGRGTTFYAILPISDYYNDPWEDLDLPPFDLSL